MEIKIGVPVSPGIAIATVYLLDSEDSPIPTRFIRKDEVETELARYEAGRERAKAEIEEIKKKVHNIVKDEVALIFDTHQRILDDPTINEDIRDRIRLERYAPEYAVSRVFRKVINAVKSLSDVHFQQRAGDFTDIQRRLLHALTKEKGGDDIGQLDRKVVVIAHDLTPSQTASFDREHIVAFATDLGGATSHTAILANALGIPAVVGLENIAHEVSGGETVIIDGTRGRVIINPDEETRKKYADRAVEYQDEKQRIAVSAEALKDETADGVPIGYFANVEFDTEVAMAVGGGACGIGLFRTEFIYAKHDRPTEEDHFQSLSNALKALGDRPMIVRTLDFGADKFRDKMGLEWEENPFLGNRSLRLCFKEPEVFRTQLRAILRASMLGRVSLMFPMVGSLPELRQARSELDAVREGLRKEGIPFDEKMPIGIMIEVPSAALIADKLALESDFFSIGTNDLVQYTLAVDRNNPAVGKLYDSAHPAVLGLIRRVIEASEQRGISVSVCGEMAGDQQMAVLLLGMGLRKFSTAPSAIPRLKTLLSRVTVKKCEDLWQQCATCSTGDEVRRIMRDAFRRMAGETV